MSAAATSSEVSANQEQQLIVALHFSSGFRQHMSQKVHFPLEQAAFLDMDVQIGCAKPVKHFLQTLHMRIKIS